MLRNFELYRYGLQAPEGAAAGGGAAAPAAAGGAPAGGGGTPAAAGGTPPSGGTPAGGGGAWYQSYGLDQDTVSWIETKKFDGPGTALKSGAMYEKLARERNAMFKP